MTRGHDSSPGRPLLFVDIDGVLNPYGPVRPDGYADHWLFPEDDLPVRICDHHADWLRKLAEQLDLVWGSAWTSDERILLSELLPLPTFCGAAELPRGPFDPVLKVEAIDQFAGDRPLAWIDDMLTPEAWKWASGRVSPTLLIPIDPHMGLQHKHVAHLLGWAATTAHG